MTTQYGLNQNEFERSPNTRTVLPCESCVDQGLALPATAEELSLVTQGLAVVCRGDRVKQIYMRNRGYFEDRTPILEVVTETKCPNNASSATMTSFG